MPLARLILLALFLVPGCLVSAQDNSPWQLQSSGTTAGLRGIDSVNGVIAWASGSDGTILRTTDAGAHWQRCATPDSAKDGATLDFRGIQAFNASSAIVMASGPGAKSRLYQTSDACASWTLFFANPDAPNGFFDSFWFNGPHGIIVGDPVRDQFTVFLTDNRGKTWRRDEQPSLSVKGKSLGAFAASNSSIPIGNALFARAFAAGGKSGTFFFNRPFTVEEDQHGILNRVVRKEAAWQVRPIPVGSSTESSGVFSVAYRYPVTIGDCPDCGFDENSLFIAVGGDYTHPEDSAHTAAFSTDGGWTWTASTTMPHGYRSAVQYSEPLHLWITAGTNGSDYSRDDGRTWHPLDNGPWNALSLPFAVGPNGRIAKLNPAVVPIR